MTRYNRILLATVILIPLIGFATFSVQQGDQAQTPVTSTGKAAIGGSFRLTSHTGQPLASESLNNQPFAVFFGFTHCPDVCPTTLFELTQDLEALGTEADRLKVLFVSVDPQRDTTDLLTSYLQSFDPRIIGLTGTEVEIASVAKLYGAYYEKVPTEGSDYTMNHTATVYLMDPQGEFAGALNFQESQEVRLSKLRRLLRKA